MIKIRKIAVSLTILASFFYSTLAKAEESPLSFELMTMISTDYMFRGQNLYDGTSIQPSATIYYDTGYGKLSATSWMHLSAEGNRQSEKFTELDETLTYSINLEPATLKLGHIWYIYPDNNDEIKDTAEFFATVLLDDSELSPFTLNPSLTIYKDYREIEYVYYELVFSHKFEAPVLGSGFNFTPSLTFAFASNAEKIYEDNGLEQIVLGTAFNLKLGDVSVIPSINYTFKVDDNTTNEFWFITCFSYSS